MGSQCSVGGEFPLQDEMSSGDRSHSNVNVLVTTGLYT